MRFRLAQNSLASGLKAFQLIHAMFATVTQIEHDDNGTTLFAVIRQINLMEIGILQDEDWGRGRLPAKTVLTVPTVAVSRLRLPL